MAFEKINQYTNSLADKYVEFCNKEEKCRWEGNTERANNFFTKADQIIDDMYMFYETVLQTKKFVSQKKYLIDKMMEINPISAKAYFKIKS